MALVMSWSTKTTIASKPLDGGSFVMKSMETVEKGVALGSGGIGWRGMEGQLVRFFVD